MKQKVVERNALIVSLVINIIMTGAGLWVFVATGIQALFLDFFFSFIASLSAITAIIISKISIKKTKCYPNGLHFLEPLYAIFKSLFTLSLLVVSVFNTAASAYAYFMSGIGEPMMIGPILPYSLLMVVLCFGVGTFNIIQNKKINGMSMILSAESKTNFIDGLLSLSVGVAIIPLYFIPLDSSLGFMHYTGDFFITIVLVLVSLKVPIKVLVSAFRELSGGTTNDQVLLKSVQKMVEHHLSTVAEKWQCHIYKIGMHVKVRINLSSIFTDVNTIKDAKENLLSDLSKTYESVDLTLVV